MSTCEPKFDPLGVALDQLPGWRPKEVGERVRYVGCSDEQVNWGGNDDPRGVLTPGNTYTISGVKAHRWHTKVEVEGHPGSFNSVYFERVDEEEGKK